MMQAEMLRKVGQAKFGEYVDDIMVKTRKARQLIANLKETFSNI
jgi:hypothetical protein